MHYLFANLYLFFKNTLHDQIESQWNKNISDKIFQNLKKKKI